MLHSFAGHSDGAGPLGALVGVDGKLYGTTSGGGSADSGTVFSITTTGTEAVLFSFDGLNGNEPKAGLVTLNGRLYGTTYGAAQLVMVPSSA